MQRTLQSFTGKGGRAVFVIGVHVILIYAVATSLGIVKPPQIIAPMQAVLINAPEKTSELEPPVIKPDLTPPEFEVPMPETPQPVVVETAPVAVEATPLAEPTSSAITADLAVKRRIEPSYPPASRRMGEEGTVTLNVMVDERGRPLQVSIERSSGFPQLDESAAQAIKRWLFAPAVQDSRAIRAWTRVKVTFRLDG